MTSFADSVPPDPSLHRILIVDDEEIVLVALRETLRREGYEVVTALSAAPALDWIKQKPFSVILSDQQMPGMKGLDLLKELYPMDPTRPIILMTGFHSPEVTRVRAKSLSHHRHHYRPLSSSHIALQVEDLLPRPKHRLPIGNRNGE